MKEDLKGKVGTSVARNISKREGWENGTLGTRPEQSRTHGDTLINEKSKQSDHTPGLTDFEKRGGQKYIRVRKGSPVLGNKKFAR